MANQLHLVGGGLLVIVLSLTVTNAGPLPAFLKVCNRNDPKLDQCVLQAFKSLEPRLKNGIPDLFIPPMEPLVIPEIKMSQDSGAIYMNSVYKNVKVSGLSKHKLTELKIIPSQLKFIISMHFPELRMQSDYNMKGKIMMMPLVGEGQCDILTSNVTMETEMLAQEYKKKGATHLKIKDIKVTYDVGAVKLKLDNLFNGDKVMGERMNAFLNENWKALSDEARPLMSKAMIEIFRVSIDQLFDNYSYDELMPKS